MNNIDLLGRTTKEIEIKTVGQDLSFAGFTLAVPRDKKGECDYIRCKAFGKTAETLAKYVKKGNMIAVNGRIQTGSYDKDGQKVYTTDIIVNKFWFTSGASGATDKQDNVDENLPF